MPNPSNEQIERNIAAIVEADRLARGVASTPVIARKATPEEIRALDERRSRRPIDELLAQPIRRPQKEETVKPAPIPSPRALPPDVAIVQKPTAAAAPTPVVPTNPNLSELLSDGFEIADSERNRLRAALPLVSCRPNGNLRLNQWAVEVFGDATHLFILVDRERRRLAITSGKREDAHTIGVAPRSFSARGSEAVLNAPDEVVMVGMVGDVSRQFRPGKVAPGMLVISVDEDEITRPARGRPSLLMGESR